MRKYGIVTTVVGFVAVLGSSPLFSANLITNGSFETPVVPVGTFVNFLNGSTGITGWTVVGPEASIVSGSFHQECCNFPAEDGVQWVDLTGDGTNLPEGVKQTVATSPGTQYSLTFWVGNVHDPGGIFGTTSSVNVLLDGNLLDTVTNSSTTPGTQIWEKFTENFTATGSASTITFLNNDPRTDNSNGLDNVSLETVGTAPVPEPATIMLLSAGLAVLVCFRRHSAR